MAGALFAAEILDATAAVDEIMGELWQLQPCMPDTEVRAPAISDPYRQSVIFIGTFTDEQAKPDLPNSYDRRQVRRPGEESGHTHVLVSPATQAALGLKIRQTDLLVRQCDGVTWRVASVFRMVGGTLKLTVNVAG